MSFSDQVGHQFLTLFAHHKPNDLSFLEQLKKTITDCFHISSPYEEEQKALEILECIFKLKTGCSLSDFLEKFQLKKEKKHFLATLLNNLYHGELSLNAIQPETFVYVLLQIIAVNVSKSVLRSNLRKLSLKELISLVFYIHRNPREGFFYIFNACENLLPKKTQQQVTHLITNIQNHFFSPPLVPLQEMTIHELESLNNNLEEEAIRLSKLTANTFRHLISLIIQSPISILKELGKQKTITPEEQRQAYNQSENLRDKFSFFLKHPPTDEEFIRFFRIFGLHTGLRPISYKGVLGRVETIVEKIEGIHEIFCDPQFTLLAEPQALSSFIAYALTIAFHLEALQHKPRKYVNGLKRLTCAIPTCNKDISELTTLPSILKGLSSLINTINPKLTDTIQLKDFPVFIYDQSEAPLCDQNRKATLSLNSRFNSSIIHIKKHEIIGLARKLGIEHLIDTTGTGFLGYGGARNCVFLLTPILKQAFLSGLKTVDQILNTDTLYLQGLFRKYTLGDEASGFPSGSDILMVDDDMYIPASNIFSHIFFAEECAQSYSVSPGYNIGRGTKYGVQFYNLEKVLNNSTDIFGYTQWLPYPFSAGMSEYMSKPRFCLNIPFGCEERHLIGKVEINPLLAPSIHLAGTRFPSKNIPTSPILGLETHLTRYIPYALHIAMVTSLIDPNNQHHSCILPWNSENIRCAFNSLLDVFTYISSEKVTKTMLQKFWRNFECLFQKPVSQIKNNAYFLRTYLDQLLQTNVDKEIKKHIAENTLTVQEMSSLKKIGRLYKFYQKDATYLMQFASLILEQKPRIIKHAPINLLDKKRKEFEAQQQIKVIDFPLTYGLYLMMKTVGTGKFNRDIDFILQI